jgi:phosphatidylserine/phosphatidylglycerophosphate/cardiolipin synthase-like enzyme
LEASRAPQAFLKKLHFFTTPPPANQSSCTPQALFHGPTIKKTLLGLIDSVGTTGAISLTTFVMTDDAICDALIKAYQRGVQVTLVADHEYAHKPWSKIPHLMKRGIPVHLYKGLQVDAQDRPGIMHNKFIIFESPARTIAVTGSYNLTHSAANKNQENMVLIDHPETIQEFKRQFSALKDRSV